MKCGSLLLGCSLTLRTGVRRVVEHNVFGDNLRGWTSGLGLQF